MKRHFEPDLEPDGIQIESGKKKDSVVSIATSARISDIFTVRWKRESQIVRCRICRCEDFTQFEITRDKWERLSILNTALIGLLHRCW